MADAGESPSGVVEQIARERVDQYAFFPVAGFQDCGVVLHEEDLCSFGLRIGASAHN